MKTGLILILAVISLGSCATAGMKNPEPGTAVVTVPEIPDSEQMPAPKTIIRVPHVQKETRFFRDGSLDNYTIFSYDDRDFLSGEKVYTGSGDLLSAVVYTIKGELTVRKESFSGTGGLTGYIVFQYDSGKNLVFEKDFNGKNQLQLSSEYIYSAAGVKSLRLIRDGIGTLMSSVTYQYKNGFNTRTELYSGSKQLQNVFEKKYDGEGRLIKEITYLSGGIVDGIVEFKYDNGNLVSESHLDKAGSLVRRYIYENDEYGSPVRISLENNRGIIIETVERNYFYTQKEAAVE